MFQLFEEKEIDGCNLFQQCEQNLFGDEEFTSYDIATVFQQEENLQQQPLLLFESYSSCPLETNLERANKKLKTNTILHEVGPLSQTQLPQNRKGSLQKQNVVETKNKQGQGTKRSVAHDVRIITDRKRREKIGRCLITIAALIPGLKKVCCSQISLYHSWTHQSFVIEIIFRGVLFIKKDMDMKSKQQRHKIEK